MIRLHEGKHLILNDEKLVSIKEHPEINQEDAKKETLTYQILKAHNQSRDMENLQIKFDEMVGEDFTRGEVITLFMAMLELLKLQVINVRQTEMFGDIELIKGENFNG